MVGDVRERARQGADAKISEDLAAPGDQKSVKTGKVRQATARY